MLQSHRQELWFRVDLDYVLESENDPENRQYIIPWSREKHLQSIKYRAIYHMIVWWNKTKFGDVILAGLFGLNQSI